MGKEERNTYTIKADENLGEVKIADEVVAVIAGLVVGVIIGNITEYYTSADYKPVQGIGEQSETGAATTIISGIAVGMKSTAVPVLVSCCLLYTSPSPRDRG